MKGEDSRDASYWRANLRLLAVLLAIWFAVSFGLGILLVVPLNEIHVGGFPLGFWFSQQGAILVFVVLVLVYALAMDRLERRRGPGRGADGAPDEGPPAE